MNHRQAEYVKIRMDQPELSKRQATFKAGYQPTTGSQGVERSPAVTNALVEAFRRKGLDEDGLAARGLRLLEANQTHHYTHKGRVIEKRIVADNSTRQKAFEYITEIYGYKKYANIETVNLGIIQVPADAESDSWGTGQVEEAEIMPDSRSHNLATMPKAGEDSPTVNEGRAIERIAGGQARPERIDGNEGSK